MELSEEDFRDLRLKFIVLYQDYLAATKNVYNCEQIFFCNAFFAEIGFDFLKIDNQDLSVRMLLQKIQHLLNFMTIVETDHPRQEFCFRQIHRL